MREFIAGFWDELGEIKHAQTLAGALVSIGFVFLLLAVLVQVNWLSFILGGAVVYEVREGKLLAFVDKLVNRKHKPENLNMIISAISDTHGQHWDAIVPDGDVFIHAGDWTGPVHKTDKQFANAAKDLGDWLKRLPHKHKIVIAGNHDEAMEIPAQAKVFKQMFEDAGVTYLEDQATRIDGVNFYGSPWTPEFCGWSFMQPRDKIRDKWRLIPDTTDVLITHGPPAHTLDKSCKGDVCGCAALFGEVTFRILPTVHIFGHIHDSAGMAKNADTVFANVAALDDNYIMKNPGVVLELQPKSEKNIEESEAKRKRYNH